MGEFSKNISGLPMELVKVICMHWVVGVMWECQGGCHEQRGQEKPGLADADISAAAPLTEFVLIGRRLAALTKCL